MRHSCVRRQGRASGKAPPPREGHPPQDRRALCRKILRACGPSRRRWHPAHARGCLVVARISYRPEDIFASRVDGSVPIFRGRDFSAKEVNGNGGSCLVVARISDYAWEHAAAGTYSDTITFTASLETANAAG